MEYITAINILCVLPIHLSISTPPHPPSANTDLFTVSIVFPFPKCQIVGIV